MRHRAFEAWQHDRKFKLPDDEEAELLRRLKAIQHRSVIAAAKQKESSVPLGPDGQPEPLPPVPSDTTEAAAILGHKALLAYRECFVAADGSRHASVLCILPQRPRQIIFEFVPVLQDVILDDLSAMHRILQLEDAEVLRHPDAVIGSLDAMHDALVSTHFPRVTDFAITARCIGLELPPNDGRPVQQRIHHLQLMSYSSQISTISKMLAKQKHRMELLAQWARYREQVLNTPCIELASFIRQELGEWEEKLVEWHRERADVPVVVALHEVSFLKQRAMGVEYLGSPNLELDDVRNMFWELSIPVPDGINNQYVHSLTFAQAATLGITDIPWVRGYVWESRPAPIAEGTAAVLDATLRTNASKLDGADDSIEAMQRSLQEEIENENKAWTVAATQTAQRLWISTERFKPRTKHRFCGCEICTRLPIHRVGLKKDNSGASDDIALCETCYREHYSEDRPVIHKMYLWYDVKQLVAGHEDVLLQKETAAEENKK